MVYKKLFLGKNSNNQNLQYSRDDLINELQKNGFKDSKIMLPKQIHSNITYIIDSPQKIFSLDQRPQCDALITNQENVALGVITADCAPILLYDKQQQIFAAIHAGWRGALNGVIVNAVNDMKKLGATDIEGEIGPMIQKNSYEVSEDLYESFTKQDFLNEKFFFEKNEINQKNRKFLFDLNDFIVNQLNSLNIKKIINHKIDTYQQGNNFFSYRFYNQNKESNKYKENEQVKDGRNISIIF